LLQAEKKPDTRPSLEKVIKMWITRALYEIHLIPNVRNSFSPTQDTFSEERGIREKKGRKFPHFPLSVTDAFYAKRTSQSHFYLSTPPIQIPAGIEQNLINLENTKEKESFGTPPSKQFTKKLCIKNESKNLAPAEQRVKKVSKRESLVKYFSECQKIKFQFSERDSTEPEFGEAKIYLRKKKIVCPTQSQLKEVTFFELRALNGAP
jgi:hypothetical protein